MPRFKTLDDASLEGKRVLLRLDLNVPMKDGRVTDSTRIDRSLPTIRKILAKGGRVIVLSHFGRPKGRDATQSLRPLVQPLSQALGLAVAFAEDCVGAAAEEASANLAKGGVLLLENLRFHSGEEGNDKTFAAGLAKLGDLYVNDAFSVSHRAHASVEAVARLLPSYAGLLMQEELQALTKALEKPERPVAAIVGGAKVSTKLDLLGNLVAKVQLLIIGGGMANTFLYAQGKAIGKSLCEKDMAETARQVLAKAKAAGCEILLTSDGLAAVEFKAGAHHSIVSVDDIPADRMILDVGPISIAAIEAGLARCRTLVWNGPLGAFEIPPFDAATVQVARAVARLTSEGRLLSVAGGGDTVAALAAAGVEEKLSYVSAAGGAFLEWLEGKSLPGVAALA